MAALSCLPEFEAADLKAFQYVRESAKVLVRALFMGSPLPEIYPDAQFVVTMSHGRVVGLDINDRFHFDNLKTGGAT